VLSGDMSVSIALFVLVKKRYRNQLQVSLSVVPNFPCYAVGAGIASKEPQPGFTVWKDLPIFRKEVLMKLEY